MDKNSDGLMSKKEFYYALMEEEFETLSTKYGVPALELEFEAQDLDKNKKISLSEWSSIFQKDGPKPKTEQKPRKDEKSAETKSRTPTTDPKRSRPARTPAPPPPAPKPQSEIKMHIGNQVKIGQRTAFLAEDATWLQTESHCTSRGTRLCKYNELCPDITSQLSAE
eukprot:CAMPEP_0113716942 /NCGR_PEP_ID=MMETSP0038_2-20120614/34211_1 /TAXON_ID=2898 /ORGANISM="Cryptomonas paramecium" /LENGTH=166 /DNA_ID=CAMNT_0000644603 /DNA_START=102 /DNA_END=599 /DNA_ORIENTATION=+ /assembly_acc=CAM_ASM_000170